MNKFEIIWQGDDGEDEGMETINLCDKATNGPPLIEWGVAVRSFTGQAESGDQYLVKPFPDGILVGVVDGLGHGPIAAAVAKTAVATLEGHSHESVIPLLKRCHKELIGTRGVVMSLASFSALSGTMTWLGVGNVKGLLLRADAKVSLACESPVLSKAGSESLGFARDELRRACPEPLGFARGELRRRVCPEPLGFARGELRRVEGLLLRGGVVGYRLPLLRPAVIPVMRGDTLVFATDGIRTGFADGLILSDPPQQTADRILARCGSGTDDALVLVVRYSGGLSPALS